MTTAPLPEALLASWLAVPDDEMSARILRAAVTQVEMSGLRRTTMDDVAQRAGVGRATVYRRFQDKNALVRAVFVSKTRGWLEQLDRVLASAPTLADRLVEGFVTVLRIAREDRPAELA